MANKQVTTDAAAYAAQVQNEYKMYFRSLLHNTVSVENLPEDVPKRYFLRTLFKYGRIGYANGYYLPVYGIGVDIYGLPTQYVLHGYNGVVFTKDAKDTVVLRINDYSYPIYPFLDLRAKQIAEIETSIHQNLFAVRTQAVYECADQATLLSLQNAYKQRKLGSEVIFQTAAFAQDNKLTVHETGAEFICDKLYNLKVNYINDVYVRLGIMTQTEKAERVQAAEVNANIGLAYENVYIMVDTFNHDAEVGGLNIRLKVNGSIEDYFESFKQNTEGNDTDELY